MVAVRESELLPECQSDTRGEAGIAKGQERNYYSQSLANGEGSVRSVLISSNRFNTPSLRHHV